MLKAYFSHWGKYVQGVRYLDRLFHYLNHEWVKKKRVSDADIAYGAFEADELVLEIGELGLDIWMKQMLQPLQVSYFYAGVFSYLWGDTHLKLIQLSSSKNTVISN